MGQEEDLLVLTKIELDNVYKVESETNTSSGLLSCYSPSPILSLATFLLLLLLLLPYTMSQYSIINYKQII